MRKQKIIDSARIFTTPDDALGLDYYPDLIEVTFDDDIDTDTIRMYFESKCSGGEKEKIIESVKAFEEGVIHVKFESPNGKKIIIIINGKKILITYQ